MTVLAASGSPAAANPWVVAAIVVVPTFMEVLDTTIAVVALRYIAGGLSATANGFSPATLPPTPSSCR
jgi:DHA2 family multidrug resistance protein